MERVVKFRGKDAKSGEWVYGYYVGENTIIPFGKVVYDLGFVDTSPCNEVIPETIGQFTGLLDKNGKEIYEGDVIKVITFGFDSEKFITEIKYGCSGGVLGFHLANGRSLFYFGQSDYSRLDDTTIIGNIHDNPNLLNDGND